LDEAGPRVVTGGPRQLEVGGVVCGAKTKGGARAAIGTRAAADIRTATAAFLAFLLSAGLGMRSASAGIGASAGVPSGVTDRVPDVHLGVVVGSELLQQKERARGVEGVGRGLADDDGLEVAVLGVEPAQHIRHLA
jgi:hypothetical protein